MTYTPPSVNNQDPSTPLSAAYTKLLLQSVADYADEQDVNQLSLSPTATSRNVVQPTAATVIPLVLKGAASQTADLIQLRTSANDVGLAVGSDFKLKFYNGTGGTADTYLYRSASAVIKTDGKVNAVGGYQINGVDLTLSSIPAPTGNVSLNSKKITNLLDPGGAQDAATKSYVDSAVSGAGVVAGGGLTLTGVTLDVGAGTGITVNPNDVAVDTSVISTKSYADSVGGLNLVTAGAGLTKSGNTMDVGAGTGIQVNANDLQISPTYTGQTSITTLGTIATGTWQGTAIASTYLDTNIAYKNAANTFTLAQTIAPTANPTTSLTVSPTISVSSSAAQLVALTGSFTGTGDNPRGLNVGPTFGPPNGTTYGNARSLHSLPTFNPVTGATITTAHGFAIGATTGSGGGAITALQGMTVGAPTFGSIIPGTAYGVRVNAQGNAGIGTVGGLRIDDQAAGTFQVGADIAAQTGGTTTVGLRIATPTGSTAYALQLSGTGGTAASGITFGTDTTLYRAAADTLQTDDALRINNASLGISSIADTTHFMLSGYAAFTDANPRFRIRGDGQLAWGTGGASAVDTLLSRAGAAQLSLNTARLSSVVDPTAAQDAATKNYVDGLGTAGGSIQSLAIDRIEFYGHSGFDVGTYDTGFDRGAPPRIGALLNASVADRTIGGAVAAWSEVGGSGDGGWGQVWRWTDEEAVERTIATSAAPYAPERDFAIVFLGANDLGWLGPNCWTPTTKPFPNAMRAIVSRLRASSIFEEDNTDVFTFTGTWTDLARLGFPTSNYMSGVSSKKTTSSAATFTATVPSDFPGGTFVVSFLCGTQGEGAQWDYTVDGGSAGSIDTRNVQPVDYTQTTNASTITSTYTLPQATIGVADTSKFSATGGLAYINDQLITYTGRSTSSGAGNLTGCTGGTGSQTSGSPIKATVRTNGVGIVVKRFTGLSAGAHTIAFSIHSGTLNTSAIVDSAWIESPNPPHIVLPKIWNPPTGYDWPTFMAGAGYPYAASQTDMDNTNALMDTIAAEFDSKVTTVALQSTVNGDATLFGLVPSDLIHLNEDGHAKIANTIYQHVLGLNRTSQQHAYGDVRMQGINRNPKQGGSFPTNTTLSAAVTLPTGTIGVNNLAGFNSAGFVFINDQLVQYTGKSAGSGAGNLTGCTMGGGLQAINSPVIQATDPRAGTRGQNVIQPEMPNVRALTLRQSMRNQGLTTLGFTATEYGLLSLQNRRGIGTDFAVDGNGRITMKPVPDPGDGHPSVGFASRMTVVSSDTDFTGVRANFLNLSGDAGEEAQYAAGRLAQESAFGTAGAAGDFFSDSAAGETVFASTGNQRVLLGPSGLGTHPATLVLTNGTWASPSPLTITTPGSVGAALSLRSGGTGAGNWVAQYFGRTTDDGFFGVAGAAGDLLSNSTAGAVCIGGIINKPVMLGLTGNNSRIHLTASGIGFHGATPIAAPAYTNATYSTRRTAVNSATVTTQQLADLVMTLLDDLGASGAGYGLLA